MKSKIDACLAYFLETPGLNKVLIRFVEKYRSFGSARGSIVLGLSNSLELEALEGFTGKNFHGKKKATLSAALIQASLDKSRYSGVLFDQLLEAYYKGSLRSKKQEAIEKEEKMMAFFEELWILRKEERAGKWLKEAKVREAASWRFLKKKYREKESKQQFFEELQIVFDGINALPVYEARFEYLPAFCAELTKDPHYFDEGNEYTLLLYYAIAELRNVSIVVSSSMAAEDKHQLLFAAGLIRDDLSNDVLIYGLRADKKEGEHAGIAGFFKEKEPLSLTLSTILKLVGVQCLGNKVYVVENPIVFAKLIHQKNISAICVNGQPNLAALLLLDRIAAVNAAIYYNGDFDPEGLLIAQRLKNRYQEALHFWHYEEADYERACSEKEVSLKRLKMLDMLTAPELKRIAARIKETRRAGYQERIQLTILEELDNIG